MLVCMLFEFPAYGLTLEPTLEGEAAILLDLTTGEILYEKNADERLYPASTTKMMTCILALEHLDMNKVLTMDDEVHATGGSVLGLKDGENISVKDLVNALMVRSANDCGVGIAKGVSGSVSDFANEMNAKAKELGCTGTHFVNPHGLHADDHYTTARDLSIIAQYCMKNETFREIVKQPNYTVPATNMNEEVLVVNTNYMLYDESDANRIYVGNELRYCKYEGCIGIKTGYTSQAGGCLVAAATRGNTTLLSVVLKSSTYGRFADSIKLLDWGFENYRTLNVASAGMDLGTIPVKKGEFNKVGTELASDIFITVPNDAADSVIQQDPRLDESVKAPVAAGTVVGKYVIVESGTEVAEYDIITTADIAEGGILSNFGIEDSVARKIKYTILGIILVLFTALVVWVLYKRHETKVKRARRDAKRAAYRAEQARKRAEWEAQYDRRYEKPVPPDERDDYNGY